MRDLGDQLSVSWPPGCGSRASPSLERVCELLPDPTVADEVSAEHPFSLIAAAALWSGWLKDVDELRQSCLVVKALAA